jgi:hypothetical protein
MRIVLLLLATGTLLDLTVPSIADWFGRHQFATSVVAEGLLIAVIVFGLDYLVSVTEQQRWGEAAEQALPLLVFCVDELNTSIRDAYDDHGALVDGDARMRGKQAHSMLKVELEKLQPFLTASPYIVHCYR